MSETSEQTKATGGAPLYDGDGTELQPQTPAGLLVREEGVNAGSSDVLQDDGEHLPTPEAAVAGDRPQAAPVRGGTGGPDEGQFAGAPDEGQFAGAPSQEPGFPSTEGGSSGQDAGSME